MTEPKAAIAALTLVLLAPQGALAQVASKLQAGSIMTQQDGEMPASVFSVAPGIRVDLPYLALAAHGSAWLTGQQWQIADGTLSGTLLTPTLKHFRGEVIGNASRAFFDRSLADDQFDAQARLHMLFAQNGGIWVGGGVARPWRIAVVSAVDVTGGGAWTRVGDATFSGTYTNFFFTKVAASRDSSGTTQTCGTHNEPLSLTGSTGSSLSSSSTATATDCRRQSRFSDIEGSVNWAYGWLELTGQAGYRFGDSYDVTPDSRRWAAGTAVLWITNRVAAVMGGGRIPANPSRGLPARNYANFGLMLSYSSIPRTTVPVAPMTIAAVKAFVSAYNDVVDTVRTELKDKRVPNPQSAADARKGDLFGDTMLSGMLDSMRQTVSTVSVGGLTMAAIGVSTGQSTGAAATADMIDGNLTVDDAALSQALDSDPAAVQKLLGGMPDTKGFAQAFGAVLDPIQQAGGLLDVRIDAANDAVKLFQSQMDDMDQRLTLREDYLRKQFSSLELALQQSQAQSSDLASRLASLPGG